MLHHRMSFYWDVNVGEFLFPGLNINGAGPLSGLCLILVLLSLGYEALKVVQTQARARAARERLRTSSCAASETATLLTNNRSRGTTESAFSKKLRRLSSQALMFMFHTTLGYFIMLSVMVYNGYVFIFVILGMGLGYFLFGHVSMKINMENIRARTTNVICSPRCPDEPTTSRTGCTTRTGHVNEVASGSSDASSNDSRSTPLPVDFQPSDSTEGKIIFSCRL